MHELLHAGGYYFFGKVKWSDIKLGVMLESLTPYVHYKKPIVINAYRIAALFQILILTYVLLTLIGAFMIVEE